MYYRPPMKAMFWTAFVLFVLGLLIGASPVFMALVMPEDSGWMQAGWAILFFTVPIGLALVGISLVLTMIIGIRGLITDRPRAASLLAIIGVAGCVISGVLLLSAATVGPPVAEALLLALATLSAGLPVVALVAAFFASRSAGVGRALPEATVAT